MIFLLLDNVLATHERAIDEIGGSAQLPQVEPKKWRLRASYDGIEFRWVNVSIGRPIDAQTLVEELVGALVDFFC